MVIGPGMGFLKGRLLNFEIGTMHKPVFVTISPDSSVRIAGFVTRESLDTIGMADMMAVYIPQSYNFAGNLIIVPKEQVIPIDIESGKVMTFIVSGGVSGF